MEGIKKVKRERRRAQRLSIPIKVKYKLLPKRKILEEIFTQNISGGGVSLRLAQSLQKGARLKTLLHFPGDPNPVTAVSEVIWCKRVSEKKKVHYNAGIRHIKIVPRDKERFVFLFCEMMINFFVAKR